MWQFSLKLCARGNEEKLRGKSYFHILILYIWQNETTSVHDWDAYFIEFVFRRISFPVKSFFLNLFRFQVLNPTEI